MVDSDRSIASNGPQPGSVITDEQVQFFHENGYLILKNALHSAELKRLQEASHKLITEGENPTQALQDYLYKEGKRTGNNILRRIDYVVDKDAAFRVLLGHPAILRSVEKLMGSDLIPTWDAMVMKMPHEGIEVPWHRDAAVQCVDETPVFNVDFYLDEADHDTCVWGIPGSHRWGQERAKPYFNSLNFDLSEAVPLYMQPGDVLLHEVRLLHGSPDSSSNKLRRVVYYEFRTASLEIKSGPHTPDYIPLKQNVLRACIEERKQTDYIPIDEMSFVYAPPAPFDQFDYMPADGPETYRYVHADYWKA
jgi:phytanoyl-CoA hydroxylase